MVRRTHVGQKECMILESTVDSAFNELDYSEISEFLTFISLKPIFSNKDITTKVDKILFFPGPFNFAK